MKVVRILTVIHLVLAVAHFIFVIFAPWTKHEDVTHRAWEVAGGNGFGIIAIALATILVVLAVMRLAGRSKVLPGLGVEQLTIICGAAATLNLIAFLVGWKAVFPAGTGWAIPAAYFSGSLIPQLGLLTVSAAEPAAGIEALPESRRRTMSLAALITGVAVIVFPFLAWLSSGGISLSAFDSRNDANEVSGPRFGYLLLTAGVTVVVAAGMRLRARGLAELGPNMLLSHALLGVGVVCTLVPLASVVSALRIDGLDAGIGAWLALVAGIVLIVLALDENRTRNAVAV
jgi:hypothetical protein